jgi:hypothetical protein
MAAPRGVKRRGATQRTAFAGEGQAARLPVATRCPHSIEAVNKTFPQDHGRASSWREESDPEGATPLARTASGEKGLSARVTCALPTRPRSQTRPPSPNGARFPDDVLDRLPPRPHAEARSRRHARRRLRASRLSHRRDRAQKQWLRGRGVRLDDGQQLKAQRASKLPKSCPHGRTTAPGTYSPGGEAAAIPQTSTLL